MNEYRKKIKTRMTVFMVLGLLFAGYILLMVLTDRRMVVGNDLIAGFIEGAMTSVIGVVIFFQVYYSRVLKDEAKLKAMYTKENDERMILIRQKSGVPFVFYSSGLLILAGVVAGFYNETIFATLIVAGAAQCLIAVVLKAIYSKKL